jgi:hypothetical protein
MPLATTPILLTSVDDMQAQGYDENDFGVTTPPENFAAPRFDVILEDRMVGWIASVKLETKANSGTNRSHSLLRGYHRTGQMFSNNFVTNYSPSPRNREIYRYIDQTIERLSKEAEIEHCNDFIHAYNITLLAAERVVIEVGEALDRARSGHLSRDSAIDAVKSAFKNAAPHEKIAALFAEYLDGLRTGQDTKSADAKFKASSEKLYTDTGAKTGYRDTSNWHFFAYGGPVPANNNPPIPLMLQSKDVRRAIKGPQFRVPGPLSKDLITL